MKTFLIKSFVGGLNVYANATQVEDAESPDLLNVDFSGISGVKKRAGFTKLTSSEPVADHHIQGTFSYITSSVRQILYIANGILYKYNGTGGSTQITGGTFSTTANVNASQIGTRLYFYDGATSMSYYDGANVVTTGVTAAPVASQGIFFNKRQYTNSVTSKDRTYYSKPLTATGDSTDTGSFDSGATNAGYFGFGEGSEVIGFARQSSYLYVFCKQAIFRVEPVASGATITDHSSVQISNSIGCRASRSIDNVGNDIYFLDSTIYSLGEVSTYVALRTTNVSAKITALLESMSQTDVAKATGIYYSGKEVYLLALTSGNDAYNNRVLGFSLAYKAWFLWDALHVNSWLEFTSSDDVKHLYFGSDDDSGAYVYEAYQGVNDDGAAINSYYYTKEFDAKSFDTEKLFQMWSIQFGGVFGAVTIDFLAEGVVVDTVTVTAGSSFNNADGWGSLVLGEFLWGLDYNSPDVSAVDPGISNDWRRHDLNGQEGTTFQLKFSNNIANQSFEIKQALLRFIDFSDRPYKIDSNREV